jgi:3-hydroxyacyl-CoA dehydrogenase
MDKTCGMIRGTTTYNDLAACDLIIEAAIEKMDLKIQIFGELSNACPKDTIIVSNTSTFLIEKLMEKVDNPARTAGLHYFFPANVNRLVEVINQKNTSDETYKALMAFSKQNKKVPITVKDFPGFAINPIFISSYLVLNFWAASTTWQHGKISQETLGVKYGVMWVQNGSGLGRLSCGRLHGRIPGQVGHQVSTGSGQLKRCLKPANCGTWRQPVLEFAERSVVGDSLLGSIFCISTHLIEKGVVSVKDLELGVCTALAWPKGPFRLMNEMGMKEASKRVKTAMEAGYFKMPRKFASGDLKPWDL